MYLQRRKKIYVFIFLILFYNLTKIQGGPWPLWPPPPGYAYNKVINDLSASTEELRLTQNLSDNNISKIQRLPLVYLHSCNYQAVERHIKVVTEASVVVCGIKRRTDVYVSSENQESSRKVLTRKQFAG